MVSLFPGAIYAWTGCIGARKRDIIKAKRRKTKACPGLAPGAQQSIEFTLPTIGKRQ